jgi:serine/threonine protein kinase
LPPTPSPPASRVARAGCIFAELLGRNPLFAGKDFMETITMQVREREREGQDTLRDGSWQLRTRRAGQISPAERPCCHHVPPPTTREQINVLGTRPPEELAYIRSDQALQFLSAMPTKPKVPWGTLFPEASEKALDLLDRMLQFHPSKRVRDEEK